MVVPPNHLPLPGSERSPMKGARELGPANPGDQIEVTIRLKPPSPKEALLKVDELKKLPGQRRNLSREEFEHQFGATPESIARVEAFAQEYGLTVKEVSAARRTVIVTGTTEKMQMAFGVELRECQHPTGKFRGRVGPIYVPRPLRDIIEGVFGLDNRPQARAHFRRLNVQGGAIPRAANTSYPPTQVAKLYKYPEGVDGSGECIAIVELGGGFKASDLSAYWKQINLTKIPTVSAVSVGNGSNAPTGDPNGPDGEVMLDIEITGAIAPGAKIVVYFAENTDAGFLNAITTAVHDKVNNPSVVSISWGASESSWTQQAMTSMDEAFQAAAAMGVTVCTASGDQGSTDGVNDGLNHVDFPSSSPSVLACGGTRLPTSGSETVWNELTNNEGATGGGISDVFPLPPWQQNAGVPASANSNHRVGRGVPDVAGNADPTTGYVTLVDGQASVIGGTSAVAPLWAALAALINQQIGGPVGFMNALLYQKPGECKDITSGDNGAYSAKSGWDACTGLGSPIGTEIAIAMGAKS